MRTPPKTIFLDQNQWIDLAHAFEKPSLHPRLSEIGKALILGINSGAFQIPLTANLIVETYKMKNDGHRSLIAEIQAQFSQGRVYRDRNFLIRHALTQLISDWFKFEFPEPPPLWWMSKFFVEAFTNLPAMLANGWLEVDQVAGLEANPKFALFHWLSTAPPEEQQAAMQFYNFGSDRLISSIESRRARLAGRTFAMRKKVYSASLAIDEIDRIFSVANALDAGWAKVADIGERRLKKILQKVPFYFVEIELASRIEALNRSINRNDLRDMMAYATVIPTADYVVGENLFINLARQAKLHTKYGCMLTTNIHHLEPVL